MLWRNIININYNIPIYIYIYTYIYIQYNYINTNTLQEHRALHVIALLPSGVRSGSNNIAAQMGIGLAIHEIKTKALLLGYTVVILLY